MKNQKGFSLIELLIVVVIIGIIAAIAIPNLLAARRSANEGSAISAMRTLHGAEMTYASTYGAGSYAANIAGLATMGAQNIGLIDTVLAAGSKGGYNFACTPTPPTASTPATFFCSSYPTSGTGITATGTRRFGINTDGVLRYDTTLTAHFANQAAVDGATPLNN